MARFLRGKYFGALVLFFSLSLLVIVSPFPSSLNLLGPEKFIRTTGPTNVYIRTFTPAPNSASPYTLHIVNGNPDAASKGEAIRSRVSSGRILINDQEVVSPKEFSKQIAEINKTILLDDAGVNRLEVRLDSEPQSYITLSVLGNGINRPPVADAGPDQTVLVRQEVTLDGGRSTDADGDPLRFQWKFLSLPAGSLARLSDPAAVTPTFVADVPGGYVVQLIVDDGKVDSAPDTVTITTQNSPPVADAGPDRTVFVGATVTLNGSGSHDVDGNLLTFRWSLTSRPAGSAAALSDPAAVTPTFAADVPGSYVAQLIVDDGKVDSAPDTVTITTQNSPPVADAGSDQTVFVGATVTLNGSGSHDVDGNLLTFRWSLTSRPAGSAAALSDPAAVTPTFAADVSGSYTAQLIVNDGVVDGAPDTVTITTQNSPPVADAGPDQTVFVGATVTLNGSGSRDVDGDPLAYAWSVVSTPAGSQAALFDPHGSITTFIVDRSGAYVIQLIVNDGRINGDPDTVVISTANSPPVADAGPDQKAPQGDVITLDGSGSSDVDLDPLTYQWSFTAKPTGSRAALSDPGVIRPFFVADLAGIYVAQLIVHDGKVSSEPDTVTLVIDPVNHPPVADAGADQAVWVRETVPLSGAGSSDPDGDPLTYQWSLSAVPSGSAAALSNPAGVAPSFVADLIGTYRVQLVVNDGKIDSSPQFVTVSAGLPPNRAPEAGSDAYGVDEDTVLNVAAPGVLANDADADGNPLTVGLVGNVTHGSLTLHPDGSFVYTPDANFNGADSFTYRASDGPLPSNTATVTLTVNPVPDIHSAIHIKITAPRDGDAAADPFIDVEGTVDDSQAYVEVNGKEGEVSPDGSFFVLNIRLYAGENQLTAQASNPTGQSASDTVQILYQPAPRPLSMRIVSPESGTAIESPKFEVTGFISDPTATVLVNDTLAETEEDFFKASIYACDPPTGGEGQGRRDSWTCDVTVTAYSGDGRTATDFFTYTYSPTQDPLAVSITSPAQNQAVLYSPVEIRGKIHDPLSAVSPTVVTVNGSPAAMEGDTFSASVSLEFSSEFVNQGLNFVRVRATNAVGDTADSVIKIVFEPPDRPLTVSLSLPDRPIVNFSPIRLFGLMSDSTAFVDVNGIAADRDFRSFSLSSFPLSLGENTIVVTARRPNGEIATDVRTIRYDPNYPSPPAPILNPLPPYARHAPIEVTGLTLPSLRAEIFVNGQSQGVAIPDATGFFKAAVFLSREGPNQIAARALDPSGNKSGLSGEIGVIRDTMRPSLQRLVAIIDRYDLAVSRVIVVGQTEGSARIEIQIDQDAEPAYQSAADARGGFAVPIHLSAGQHYIYVRATDPAGNIGSRLARIAVFNLPRQFITSLQDVLGLMAANRPIPPKIDPAPTPIAESAITVEGQAYAHFSVEIYRNDELVGAAPADDRGRFRLEGVPLAMGQNILRVRQKEGELDLGDRLFLLNAADSSEVAVEVVSGAPARPQVKIDFPSEGAVTDAAFLPVRGSVTGPADQLGSRGYYQEREPVVRTGDRFVSVQKIPLVPGPNTLWIEATAPDGSRGVDKITVYSKSATEVPTVEVTAPPKNGEVHERFVTPSGRVGETVQRVIVNEAEAAVQNGAFLAGPVDIFSGYVYNPEGDERVITAWAEDGSGRIGHADVPFGYRYIPPPQISNVTPLSGAVLNASPVRVTGQAAPADEVTVNGASARIDGGVFAAGVDLQEGDNIIQIIAKNTVKGTVQTIQVTYLPGLPVTLDSLKIEPQSLVLSKGDKVQLRVIGTYSNGQTLDLTPQAVWSSSQSEIAAVNGGLVVAQGEGAGIILAAAYQGLSATASLTAQPPALRSILVSHPVTVNGETLYVSDEVKLPIGQSQAFSAFGEYSDGSVNNITSSVSWSSGDAAVATVDPAGLAGALKPGSAQITATEGSIRGSAPITVVPPPIYLFITSPTDGSALHRSESTVRGTILTPAPEVGITVNGVLAHLSGNQFVANGVALADGGNTITAKATDSFGQRVEAHVMVNALTTEPQIALTANIDSGIGPLEATLKLDAPFAYTNPAFSYIGPTLDQVTVISQEEYQIKMTTEGIYTFTIQVTDSQGAAHTDSVSIVVQSKSALETLLMSKWEGMKGALLGGDVDTALSYFVGRPQEKYRAIFQNLQPSLPQIFASIEALHLLNIQNDEAEMEAIRTEGGVLYSYPVIFMRDETGMWKLWGF